MDWLKSVADFLAHWRGAFGLFGGVATAFALRIFGYATSDLEFTAAIAGGIGFWVLVAWMAEAVFNFIQTTVLAIRTARQRAEAQKAADQAAAAHRQREEQEAAAARERALLNLRHLRDWELKALVWIYHQPSSRARASINHVGIQGLYEMGLLESEDDKRQMPTDRTWRIPDHIVEALREKLGQPNSAKGKPPPPWEGKSTAW
jgi:hypothetical protein